MKEKLKILKKIREIIFGNGDYNNIVLEDLKNDN
jgi:hypothetical protein